MAEGAVRVAALVRAGGRRIVGQKCAGRGLGWLYPILLFGIVGIVSDGCRVAEALYEGLYLIGFGSLFTTQVHQEAWNTAEFVSDGGEFRLQDRQDCNLVGSVEPRHPSSLSNAGVRSEVIEQDLHAAGAAYVDGYQGENR